MDVRSRGIRFAASTESQAFDTMRPPKKLGLDGIIDVPYSAPDHGIPASIHINKSRMMDKLLNKVDLFGDWDLIAVSVIPVG